MGVQGLWELLAPVGRRVSVETLAGKKLAIDASIWMVQFIKAMRDEKGEMVRNAHILGFFRRICKLLYLRTKPVFVFDGGTPALKRRTVIARRRQRENAQSKIRKTAEKLLLNHLKAMRLKELAAGLEKQRQENDIKGKRPVTEETNSEKRTESGSDDMAASCNQEELDALLAASLAAEENGSFGVDASASGSGVAEDSVMGDGDEDDDDDEEMILPEMNGKVDPAILASLPPSMQLDLLVQMRERLMAENRQKYQKVKKAPASFSELQIQSYLKTVAFRREIDGAQKAAAGRGVGGMQTSRIASEANREFIFSSSFTGDKQALTSVGQERGTSDQSQPPPVNSSTNSVNRGASTTTFDAATAPTAAETGEAFHDDLETYLDERGRVRVSRVRALGIRMTRDLQRNLDLIKEIDQENGGISQETNIDEETANDYHSNTVNDEDDKIEEPAVVNGTSIEISFEDTCGNENGNDDDDLFARLVAGDPVVDLSVNNAASESLDSASDVEWEDGAVEEKSKADLFEGVVNDEEEVEWEEGFQDIQLKCADENPSIVTKGALQEEAELQEAIRRSIDETMGRVVENKSCEDYMPEVAREMDRQEADLVGLFEEKERLENEASSMDVEEPINSANISVSNSSEAKSAAFIELGPDKSNLDPITPVDSNILPEEKGFCINEKQQIDTCSKEGNEEASYKLVATCGGEAAVDNISSAAGSPFIDSLHDKFIDSGSTEAQRIFQAALEHHSHASKPGNISADDSNTGVNGAEELSKEKECGNSSMEQVDPTRNFSFMDVNEEHEFMKDNIEEEMVFLGKEREELGSEQRKLERNAESVSSEMFAECQELLQMFGLPYIIAPMEAEAQCAFMEQSNLVDGVVTDDSDAFLFGARSLYKNIFDDRKYVETYLKKDIENELGINREKLIHMALLLGSDYTEGVSGIGIVNAIEVVNAFPEKDGLREFREWIESPDPSIFGKLDVEGGISKVKGSKNSESVKEGISSDQNVSDSTDDAKRTKLVFMNKHRNVSKNWHIPSTFPSDAVISAYNSPQVDKSTESFGWGKPDLFVLRKLCWEKFGWGTSKADDLLLPVLKEYNKHETQLRMEAFYTFNERFAKIRSKRIKKALKGIAGSKSSELMDETKAQEPVKKGRKRKVKPSDDEANQSEVGIAGLDHAGPIDQNNTIEKPTVKRSKGRQTRGRGRGQASGRGRMKKVVSVADSETSCDDGSSTENEEVHFNKSEGSHEVRRSDRLRKSVNYSVSDEYNHLENKGEKCPSEDATNEADSADDMDANELDETRDIGMHKMSTNQIGDDQIHDPLNQSHLPNDCHELSKDDYLQFGGGFCLDEDEKETGVDESTSSPKTETVPEQFNIVVEENDGNDLSVGVLSGKTELADTEINMKDKIESDYFPLDDDDEDDLGNSSRPFLRAMPNLRRKRKT